MDERRLVCPHRRLPLPGVVKSPSGEGRRPSLPAALAVVLIRGYQVFLSPFLGGRCRFYPSCSQYAIVVFREWGFCRGFWLTLRRLLKCGPWHEGGYDPPPRRRAGEDGGMGSGLDGTPPRRPARGQAHFGLRRRNGYLHRD